MKRFLLALACVLALASLGACAVVARPNGTAVIEPIEPPIGVAVVPAPAVVPGPGYAWRYHPHYGWGWWHPGHGWYRWR
jgi:hypothetical protein